MTESKAVALPTSMADYYGTPEQLKDDLGRQPFNKIGTRERMFTFPNGDTVESFTGIIIDFVHQNTKYKGKFRPGSKDAPICVAVGKETAKDPLIPFANSPERQADACATCALNQFGPNGEAKECQNRRVFAVVPPDFNPETDELSEQLMVLNLPPTSIKYVRSYLRSILSQYQVPPIGMVTKFYFQPNVSQSTVCMSLEEPYVTLEGGMARMQSLFSHCIEAASELLRQEPGGWSKIKAATAETGEIEVAGEEDIPF